MLDDEIAAIDTAMSDPSRRNKVASPYAGRLNTLNSEARQIRDSVSTSVRQGLQSIYDSLLEEERVHSSEFAKNRARNNANQAMGRIRAMPTLGGDPTMSDFKTLSTFISNLDRDGFFVKGAEYQSQLSRMQSIFPELDSIRLAEKKFQETTNAGITTPMTSDERTALAQRRVRLESEAVARLQKTAQQFNQEQDLGLVAASKMRIPVRRPLTGRFGNPQTGVGISS